MTVSWSNWLLLTRVGLVLIRVGLVLTYVDLCRTRDDSCWLMLDSCWFVLDSCLSVLTYLDSCWFVLTRVDLCLRSCIRIDLNHFKCDHESSGFRKVAVNKWICRINGDYFLDYAQDCKYLFYYLVLLFSVNNFIIFLSVVFLIF